MGASFDFTPYRFVLPQLKKQYLGTQGQLAHYIPYRLEKDLTPEAIQAELARIPHMAQLAEHLDPSRKLYLLHSMDLEVLQLAAEYIGTFYRLSDPASCAYQEAFMQDEAEEEAEEEEWRAGDTNFMSFDFDRNLPYVDACEVSAVYGESAPDFGFAGQFYRPEVSPRRAPWWTMIDDAPLCVVTDGNMIHLASSIAALADRFPVVVLYHTQRCYDAEDNAPDSDFLKHQHKLLAELAFDLETELIQLEAPAADSPYRQEILLQLAAQADAPLDKPEHAGRILNLIANYCGDASNATLSKAVRNALLRRKQSGPLTVHDFQYLAVLFESRENRRSKEGFQKLVGQKEVRRQLTEIVACMDFQKKRSAMGLPADPLHYTFAFLGAPDTGKTTWARWLAKEMEKRRLLDNTEMICINAAELKAKYVGHTTGKVKALFDQYGIIILDEAYSLADGENGDSFGSEALAQLCVELENHDTDRLVVFAGYGGASDPSDNRMLRFLQSNPGINSRISFKIHFQNYKAEELVEVFRSMLDAGNYILPRGYTQPVAQFFQQRTGAKAFGNCREARNLADRVKLRAAARLAKRSELRKVDACRISLPDIRQAAEEILAEYRGLAREEGRSIGFGS